MAPKKAMFPGKAKSVIFIFCYGGPSQVDTYDYKPELYKLDGGFDLHDCQYTKAAGGGKDYPQLEGVKINGHWAIIYSKLDLGCALERHSGMDCKGYSYESAVRIAGNIVIYATLP